MQEVYLGTLRLTPKSLKLGATAIDMSLGSGLPSQYIQVQYIQNPIGGWLDTGIKPTANMSFETKLDLDVTKIQDDFFSSLRINQQNTRFYLLNLNSTKTFTCCNADWSNAPYITKTQVKAPYVIKSQLTPTNQIITVNGVTQSAASTMGQLPDATLPLFGGRTDIGLANPAQRTLSYQVKCYYARYFDNGTLVGDFIPCKRKSDNKVGMYNLVTDTFITGKGTGTFTAGAAV